MPQNRTDDESYGPRKALPVDRAMPREDDFGGIMYWADEDREIDMSEELKAAVTLLRKAFHKTRLSREVSVDPDALHTVLEVLSRPTPIPVGETSEVERFGEYLVHHKDCSLRGHWMEAAENECDCGLAAALSIRETQAPPAEGVETDEQSDQRELAEMLSNWRRFKACFTLSPATGQGGEA